MVVVFDEAADGKWITIHPNGSDKGKHVKVNADGEIVAGNKHLVAALKKKDAKAKVVGGGGSHSAPAPKNVGSTSWGHLGKFEPLADAGLSSLLDDGETAAIHSAVFTFVPFKVNGMEYEFGRGKVNESLLESLVKGFPGIYWKTVTGAWNGNPKCISALKGKMPADHPFIKAVDEYEKVVEARRASMPHVDFEKSAKEITDSEADKILKGGVGGVWLDYADVPLPKEKKAKYLQECRESEKRFSLRYAAVAIADLRKRFPKAQLLDKLKSMRLYPAKPQGKMLGICWPIAKVLSWGSHLGAFRCSGKYWRAEHQFILAPGCGTVPGNSFMYAENKGAEAASVFWHEVAHGLYPDNRLKWKAARKQAVMKYSFFAFDVSKYAGDNNDEYHSEVVGLMALPNYVQGSLPEPIERYVYEDVFGMEPGSWKKNESIWKPKNQ